MMIRLLIALATAAAFAAAGVAHAGLITYIDPGGAYVTACAGGVASVTVFGAGELEAACAWGDAEVVLCGAPGVVDWTPADDQILVTCEQPK